MPYLKISEQLAKNGLCVWPNFLSAASLNETRADLEDVRNAGGFRRAGIGQGSELGVHDLRRDEIHWLMRDTPNPVQSRLWEKIDSLQHTLNRNLFLGIQSFEGHYASYPKGGFYQRHRDSFRHDDARVVSVVIYLNEKWESADGGRLRVYEKDLHTDIDPAGGTLVCFFSRDSEHEVMESMAERSSFAGWFKVSREV